MTSYRANILGEDVLDYDLDMTDAPERLQDTDITVLMGTYDCAVVIVTANSEDEAEAKLLSAFQNEITIDELVAV